MWVPTAKRLCPMLKIISLIFSDCHGWVNRNCSVEFCLNLGKYGEGSEGGQ